MVKGIAFLLMAGGTHRQDHEAQAPFKLQKTCGQRVEDSENLNYSSSFPLSATEVPTIIKDLPNAPAVPSHLRVIYSYLLTLLDSSSTS